MTKRLTNYYMFAASHKDDPDWREFELTNIDQGVHLAARLDDALVDSTKHTERNSNGFLTTYTTKDGDNLCRILMKHIPNSQDIEKVIIHIHTSIVAQHEILQREMFDLFL